MEANEDSLARSVNAMPGDSSDQCGKAATNSVIHGNELKSIKEQLLGSSSPQQLCIIPISGMGGIGKTTLARTVYEDPIVVSYFDACAWITVSQQHDVNKLLREILSYFPDEKSSDGDCMIKDTALAETLCKRLKCKRYLIVADDVWYIKAWDELKRVFPDQENRSRIIVTTRDNDVANYVQQGGFPVCMSLLSTDRSLELLISRVFGQQSCPSELEEIAEDISSKCQGLPLTINVIGGVLSENKALKDHWEKVAEDINLTLGEKSDQLLDLLGLSYNFMPHHLKPCFLYLGVFPEDFEIPVSTLTRLWIAEGFIKATESEYPEEVAEGYLEDLISKNLVLHGRMSLDGRMRSCALHDLLRDLILREAKKDGFFYSERQRHEVYLPGNCDSTITRSYFYFGFSSNVSTLCNLRSFTMLRVLHIHPPQYSEFDKFLQLPTEIGQLLHLRYLATGFSHFPKCLHNLSSLETLINYQKFESTQWVQEVCKMTQLRHLNCDFSFFIPYIMKALLPNLQTLSSINLASCVAISGLPSLRELVVQESREDVMTRKQILSSLNHLKSLKSLQTLKCRFETLLPAPLWNFFPRSLKKLTLQGSRCPWEEMRVLGMLPQLEVLKLEADAFEGLIWELTDEDGECFTELRLLKIVGRDLCYWKATSMHFIKLECLILRNCWYLEEIPYCFGDLYNLRLIELDECNLSAVDSAIRIEQEQKDMGNERLVVKISSYTKSLGCYNRFRYQLRTQLFQDQHRLGIIAVSGRSGMGKTALTREIYTRDNIRKRYEVHSWMTIPKRCQVNKLLLELIHKFPGATFGSEENDRDLAEKVRLLLKGRRYLIVIDGMWSTRMWNDLKRAFPDDNNGSRIIVTTQDIDVANYVRHSSLPLDMKLLGPRESFDLFDLSASWTREFPLELPGVAEVVSKCLGLPIAISIIARTMYQLKENSVLLTDVVEDIHSLSSDQEPDQLVDLLALGFKYLPNHLKPCFFYLGVFQKYSKIPVSRIIFLWISQGFVQAMPSESMIAVAWEYLQELISRKLVLIEDGTIYGGVRTCSIHDLMYDLIIREAKKEGLLYVGGNDDDTFPTAEDSEHNTDFYSGIGSHPLSPYFLYFGSSSTFSNSFDFKMLGILCVGDDCKELHHSVYELPHLHTLISSSRHCFVSLQRRIWRMTRLRHIITGCYLPSPMKWIRNFSSLKVEGEPSLTLPNLQTLSWISFDNCSREVFSGLPNLRKLSVGEYFGRDNINSKHISHCLENLKCLKCLEALKCTFSCQLRFPFTDFIPTNLKKLTLSGCRRPWEEIAVLANQLPKLKFLKLKKYAFQGPIWEVTRFRELKLLFIDGTDLVQWKSEADSFPCLERLILAHCMDLKEIPSGFAYIQSFEVIKLTACNPSSTLSAMELKDARQLLSSESGEDWAEIDVHVYY